MAPRYPMLFEVAPERKASRHRPAASPVWTNPLSANGGPSLPGVSTLYDNFRCVRQLHSIGTQQVGMASFLQVTFLSFLPTGTAVRTGPTVFV
jgi:hypothetical protein